MSLWRLGFLATQRKSVPIFGLIALLGVVSSSGRVASAQSLATASPHTGEIAGTVTDALGNPIAKTAVTIVGPNRRNLTAYTDLRGRFVFHYLALGDYHLSAANPTYKPISETITLNGHDASPRLALTMEALQPLTMAVAAQRLDIARNALSPETGGVAYRFNQEAIHKLPAGANTEMSQVLAQAPGVSLDAAGQGQDQIHIHGENGGGIQYRLNGVFLPDVVSSYGGMFSPRFVRSLTLLTGVLPAEIGFRNEGIIDVRTKDGCVDGGTANNNVDIYGGQRSTFEPSFEYGGCKGRLSYYTSGYYSQSAVGLASPTSSPHPKHDQTYQGQGLANLSYLINSQTRLSLLTGIAINSFQIPPEPGLAPEFTLAGTPAYPSAWVSEGQFEQNYYGILSLQGTLGTKASYQLSAFSRYYALDFLPDQVGDLIYNGNASRIFQSGFVNGIQEDTSYRLTETHTVQAGLYVSGETIETDNHALTFPANADGEQTSSVPISIVNDNNSVAWVVGLYAQDAWHPLPNLTINAGTRWDWVSGVVTQNQVSPRVGFEYSILPQTVLHGGYARYMKLPPFQSVALETVQKFANTTNAAATSTGNDKISAERDDYFDFGIRQGLLRGLSIGADGFFKFGHNQLDLAQFASSQVTAPLNYRKSRSWGSDLSITLQREKLSAYLNFSYTVLQAQNITAGQFLADDPDEVAYAARRWVILDDVQEFTGSSGIAYQIFGFLLTTDGLWGSGYRRGDGNTGELPPFLQINAGIVRSLKLPWFGDVEARGTVINLFDHGYQIRNGTGIGVFSPQYGPRRTFYGGLKIPLA
ncbi:MAG TPA: TonB-dependent receptor, partial [Candidatus Binataceae bacterium]|nr:TonB-dependent receptor [Candidatus Binataceae bacterium]